MKLLRHPEPMKSFEFSLTPSERIEIRRKKRQRNASTIENKLKKIEQRNRLEKFQKMFGNPEEQIKRNQKIRYY